MKPAHKNSGFTIVEMAMTIIILVIIAAVVAPQLFNSNALQSRAFADRVQALLRSAQKTAIAQHQFVCVAFAASSVTLAAGPTNACGTPFAPSPDSASVVNMPAGVTFSVAPSDFFFDASGQPSINQEIAIAGTAPPIVVEAGKVLQ